MTSRPYFSIGEVLGLLLEEFPDITISKIRFLETQGLIDPERTPSGYRKFYESDLERLRFILREQKDRYLPLRVIKERLETSDDTLPMTPRPMPTGASWATAPRAAEPASGGQHTQVAVERGASVVAQLLEAPASVERALEAARQAPAPPSLPDAERSTTEDAGSSGSSAPAVSSASAGSAGPNPPGASAGHLAGMSRPAATGSVAARDDRQFDADELCVEAGIERTMLDELESYGLVTSRAMGGASVYGVDALHIAVVAAQLIGHGLEVRHLRTWRMNADKESALFEQLVVPLVRQRNPQSRHQAAATVEELLSLGGQLREAILRASMWQYLDR